MGNVSSISDNGRQTTKYEYDNLGRLIKEIYLDKSKEIAYTYDNNGKILTKNVDGVVTEYKYKDGTDQLFSCGNNRYVYDAMGNPTQFNGYTATFTNGKLSTLSDGYLQIYYLYNGLGRRTSKIVGGAEAIYTYDSNGNLIKEEGIQNIEYIYGANGIMGINLNGMPYEWVMKTVFLLRLLFALLRATGITLASSKVSRTIEGSVTPPFSSLFIRLNMYPPCARYLLPR